MYEAMAEAEDDEKVALILVNKGTNDYYIDKDGRVYPDHDYIE